MATTSGRRPDDARARVVRRLSALFVRWTLIQAGALLVASWGYRVASQSVLDAMARAGSSAWPAATATANVVGIALDLFVALVVGFFGARALVRAVVRATPHPTRPPTSPVPLAGLCAGVLAAAISIILFAAITPPAGQHVLSWGFELVRLAAVAALVWFAARRAIVPPPRRAAAAAPRTR